MRRNLSIGEIYLLAFSLTIIFGALIVGSLRLFGVVAGEFESAILGVFLFVISMKLAIKYQRFFSYGLKE